MRTTGSGSCSSAGARSKKGIDTSNARTSCPRATFGASCTSLSRVPWSVAASRPNNTCSPPSASAPTRGSCWPCVASSSPNPDSPGTCADARHPLERRGRSEMSHPDPLLMHREQFPITARSNYLINNSLGAMPAAARQSVARFLDQWETRGVRAWGDSWWTLQDQVADEIAGVLGVPRGTVSMHQNVATALEMILSCFRFDGSRNRIVYADRNFPSDQYIYEARARHGARLVRIPAARDGLSTDAQQVAEAIDDTTLLVAIDHVMFRSSAIVDVTPIVQKARKVGAF